MSKSIPVAACAVLVLCLCRSSFAAAAGDGDPVKNWYGKAYDSLKDSAKPICVYIYDAKVKANHKAVLMEGKTFLDNSDVASKLKGFICIKLKSDAAGSQEKTWPGGYIAGANGNASLILLSSDLRLMCQYTRDTPQTDLTSDNLVKSLDMVLNAEPKDLAEKKKKEKEDRDKAQLIANKKDDAAKGDGLGIKGITDNKDDSPKKDPKKPDAGKSDPPPTASKPKPLDD